jgi:hypothetical protein
MESPTSAINLWGGSTSRLSGGVLFFVTEYILHPQYDWWTLDNDIAVIRVDVGFINSYLKQLKLTSNFLIFSHRHHFKAILMSVLFPCLLIVQQHVVEFALLGQTSQ